MKLIRYNSQNFSIYLKIAFLFFVMLILNSPANSTMVTITVQSNFFTPSNTNVNVGDSLKFQWLNGDHTTTCDGVFPGTSLPPGAASWNSPMNSTTSTYIYVITVPGTYQYVCMPHAPDMAGTIQASASSSALLTENFDYPVGDSLGAHGWVSFSGGATNFLAVTAPGLVYSGYPLSNIGNATTVLATGQDAYKQFPTITSGSFYVAFMVNLTSVQATGDYFFGLLPSTNTSNYTARLFAKDSAGFRFGLGKASLGSGATVYSSSTYSLSTNYLMVIKYTFNPGTMDDIIVAYIFDGGVPTTEPGTPTIGPPSSTLADNVDLARVALRQGSATSSPVTRVDGIMVTTSWSDLTATNISSISEVPETFNLSQNYPNPFNPSTTINFSIPQRGFINLTVYNSIGEEVQNLVNNTMNEGQYSVEFNGSNLNSGVYFYRLNYSNQDGISFVNTKKLVLIK